MKFNIFNSAKIKLTLAFIAITMTISLAFSSVVYINFTRITEAAFKVHERRVNTHLKQMPMIPKNQLPEHFQQEYIDQAHNELKNEMFMFLFYVNSLVLIISATIGYWYSKITLKPIEQMAEKQKNFIADAAHELKTPLTSIKTQLEVTLRNTKLKIEDAKEAIISTIEDIDYLTYLTNDLLKQSRYQQISLNNKEKFDLRQLIDEVASKFDERIKNKNIDLKIDFENINLNADKNAIKELITILIDNGIKYNKQDGFLFINASLAGGYVTLKIEDGGIGIAKNDINLIFERFYKADKSRTKTTEAGAQNDGFGLGLSIAKEIVNSHNGTLSVTSVEDEGTTFTVKIPA